MLYLKHFLLGVANLLQLVLFCFTDGNKMNRSVIILFVISCNLFNILYNYHYGLFRMVIAESNCTGNL